jgi:hypothetical protein
MRGAKELLRPWQILLLVLARYGTKAQLLSTIHRIRTSHAVTKMNYSLPGPGPGPGPDGEIESIQGRKFLHLIHAV